MDRASDSGSEGWGFESLPAYQKIQIPMRVSGFFNTRVDSKGRHQCAHWCNQVSGGHLISPWESPSYSRRIRYGCGWDMNFRKLGGFYFAPAEQNANESLPAYQKFQIPIRVSGIFYTPRDSKGRHQWAHWCNQVSGGHLISPWESPSCSRRIRYGCGWDMNFRKLGGFYFAPAEQNANASLPAHQNIQIPTRVSGCLLMRFPLGLSDPATP